MIRDYLLSLSDIVKFENVQENIRPDYDSSFFEELVKIFNFQKNY